MFHVIYKHFLIKTALVYRYNNEDENEIIFLSYARLDFLIAICILGVCTHKLTSVEIERLLFIY